MPNKREPHPVTKILQSRTSGAPVTAVSTMPGKKECVHLVIVQPLDKSVRDVRHV